MSQSVTGVSSSWPRIVRPAFVAHALAGHGGEVGAGTPAGHRQLARDATQLARVLAHPAHRGRARRRPPPGSAPRARAGSRPRRSARPSAGTGRAHRVVGIVAAQHPAAAVEVDDHRMRPGRGRAVQPVGQRPAAPGSVPSWISPTGAPAAAGGQLRQQRARPAGGSESKVGRFSAAIISSTMRTSGCKRRITPSLHRTAAGQAAAAR